MKKRFYLLFCFFLFVCVACNEDTIPDQRTGETVFHYKRTYNLYSSFLQRFDERAGSRQELDELLHGKTALLGNVLRGCSEELGLYWAVPLQNSSGVIDAAVLYPVMQKDSILPTYDGILGQPILLDADRLNNKIGLTKRFLYSMRFVDWKDMGLEVAPELMACARMLDKKMKYIDSPLKLNIVLRSNPGFWRYDFEFQYEVLSKGMVEGEHVVVEYPNPGALRRAFTSAAWHYFGSRHSGCIVGDPALIALGVVKISLATPSPISMPELYYDANQYMLLVGYELDYIIRHHVNIQQMGTGDAPGPGAWEDQYGGVTGGDSGKDEGKGDDKDDEYPKGFRCPICHKLNCHSPHDDCNDVVKALKKSVDMNYDIFSTVERINDGKPRPSFDDFVKKVDEDPMKEHYTSLTTFMNDNNEEQFMLTDIRTGTETNVSGGIITPDTRADIHSHPETGWATPSALDIISIAKIANDFKKSFYSYIYSANGNVYVLVVTDPIKAGAFYRKYNNQVHSKTNMFISETKLSEDWRYGMRRFKKLGDLIQREYSLSFILQKHDAGILLLKKGTGNFKALDVKRVNNYYIPIQCQW